MTGFVQRDFADVMPSAFFATTTTRSLWPTSVELMMYVAFEARTTLTHFRPLLQRCQAYRYDVGRPAQRPCVAVSRSPTRATPVSFGAARLRGPPNVRAPELPATTSVAASRSREMGAARRRLSTMGASYLDSLDRPGAGFLHPQNWVLARPSGSFFEKHWSERIFRDATSPIG